MVKNFVSDLGKRMPVKYRTMQLVNILVTLIIFFTSVNCQGAEPIQRSDVFIRLNQVGFLPRDVKSAVIMAENPITDNSFEVTNSSGKVLFEGTLGPNQGAWGSFKFTYKIDFSSITSAGTYSISSNTARSPSFKIGDDIYKGIIESFLTFLKIQRCGPTNPLMHKVCHLFDSPRIAGDPTAGKVDVTGGWHDAGDYVKFVNTTALTTYILLFSYQFDPARFEFDSDNSGAPDILEEARIGIDWILRVNYGDGKIITQVQDNKDHTVGFRLPENDPLQNDRPAFSSIGKNSVGMCVAVLSLAAKIWRDRFYDNEVADRWLTVAENLYSVRNSVPDVDKTPDGMYQDSRFLGKLALGAIELYNTTGGAEFLSDAIEYGDQAGSDYWWSWGDLNSLAQFRIAQVEPRFKDYILNNLTAFNANKSKNIFGEGAAFTWGTTNTLLGVAFQAILYKKLTGSSRFDSLAVFQRDYMLGKNPWGVSFAYKYGTTYAKNFHHQIAKQNYGKLPGGIAAGPIPLAVYQAFSIDRKNFQYNRFNSDSVLYFDDYSDYLSNEPTIMTNATAIFVFSQFIQKQNNR